MIGAMRDEWFLPSSESEADLCPVSGHHFFGGQHLFCVLCVLGSAVTCVVSK